MVDLFLENSHLLLQLLSPKSPHGELEHTTPDFTDWLKIHLFCLCVCACELTSVPLPGPPPSSCAVHGVPPHGRGLSPAGWCSPAPSLPATSGAPVGACLSSRCLLLQSSTSPPVHSDAPSVCYPQSRRDGEKRGAFSAAKMQFTLFVMVHNEIKNKLSTFVTCSLSFSSWCFFSASWSCAYKRLLTSLSLVLSASSSAS